MKVELTTMVLKVARFVNLISPEEWRELRECWERLHIARALLNVVSNAVDAVAVCSGRILAT